MRLTLRTLLAYLDDTLEPAQARQIGQKVAESDTAQELIARIKQVTRRRRLTTPPESGPNKIDPNTIAEYLDNTLSPDQLADVEQLCLASDVHLAEMASCHQILTLVLGEPALVPPTAKQRMYALVKGREAIPFRKPPAADGGDADEPGAEGKEVDETLRLGLPALRRKEGWRNPLIILGGALGLVACLVVAIIQLLPSAHKQDSPRTGKGEESLAKANLKTNLDKGEQVVPPADAGDRQKKPVEDKKAGAPKTKDKQDAASKGADKQDGGDKQGGDKGAGKPEKTPKDTGTPKDKTGVPGKTTEVPVGPPSTRVVAVGRFEPPVPPATTVLLQYDPDKGQWARLERQVKATRVVTARPLVSLPGFRSVLHTDSGVRLTLAGTMPEFYPGTFFLYESLVELHANDALDLDFTLRRGRVFLTNTRADRPARVRVRFVNTTDPAAPEVWDLTLEEKDAEVMIDCFGFFDPPGQPFYANAKDPQRQGPATVAGLTVLHGPLYLRAGSISYAMNAPSGPGPAQISWNSQRKGLGKPQQLKELPVWARPEPAVPKDLPKELEDLRLKMKSATGAGGLSKDLLGPGLVEVGLQKSLASAEPAQRRLAVRCFGALGMVPQLVDALSDKQHLDVRQAAIDTLMHWLASGRDNDYRLFEELRERFKAVECENIISMLHGPLAGPKRDPQLFEGLIDLLCAPPQKLAKKSIDPPLAIRELAAWQLYAAFPQAYQDIHYDATAPRDVRQRIQAQWRKFVRQGGKAPK
jgi:hypothetical protein